MLSVHHLTLCLFFFAIFSLVIIFFRQLPLCGWHPREKCPHGLSFFLVFMFTFQTISVVLPCSLAVPPISLKSKHLTTSFMQSDVGPRMLGNFIFAFTPLCCTLCCTTTTSLHLFSRTSSYRLSSLSCLITLKKKKRRFSYSHYLRLYSKLVLDKRMYPFGHPSGFMWPGFVHQLIFASG